MLLPTPAPSLLRTAGRVVERHDGDLAPSYVRGRSAPPRSPSAWVTTLRSVAAAPKAGARPGQTPRDKPVEAPILGRTALAMNGADAGVVSGQKKPRDGSTPTPA